MISWYSHRDTVWDTTQLKGDTDAETTFGQRIYKAEWVLPTQLVTSFTERQFHECPVMYLYKRRK